MSAIKDKIIQFNSPQFRSENSNKFKQKMLMNDYTEGLCNVISNKIFTETITVSGTVRYLKILYANGLSEKLTSTLSAIRNKIALYHTKTIGNLYVCMKGKLPSDHRSNVV